MKNAHYYRNVARLQLQNNIFGSTWLMFVLALLITYAIGAVFSATAIGGVLVYGFLSVGLFGISLRLDGVRRHVDLEDLFEAKDFFASAILLAFLKALMIFLWSLLFIIPGIIKAYSWAMAERVLHDRPGYSWKYCLKESSRLMKGNKWRLFCLQLSFIGWYIVGSLCFGVGVLWVETYRIQAETAFYRDLVAQKQMLIK